MLEGKAFADSVHKQLLEAAAGSTDKARFWGGFFASTFGMMVAHMGLSDSLQVFSWVRQACEEAVRGRPS